MKHPRVGARCCSIAVALLLAAPLAAQQSSLFDRLISGRDDTRSQAVAEVRGLDPAAGQQLIAQLIERFTSAGLDSYFASLALGGLGEPAVAPLMRAVRSADRRIRYRASESLGRIGPPALDPVIDVLSDSSPDTRCAASHALDLMHAGAAKAVPMLTPLLQTGSADLTRCVIQALGFIGSDEALGALRSELGVEEFSPETLNALAVMRHRAEAATADVLPLLKSTDPSIRMIAARTLGEIAPPSPVVVTELVASLSDVNSLTRQQAAHALGKLGPPAAAAIPKLRQVLAPVGGNEDRSMIFAAVEALGKMGAAAAEAVPDIIRFWVADDPTVRRASVEAITRIGPAAIPSLVAALRDPLAEIRGGAAWHLGELDAGETVPALAEALRDQDAAVRAAARSALGKMTSSGARAALADAPAKKGIAPRLLTLAEVQASIPPDEGYRGARALETTANLDGPAGMTILATVHSSDDRGDLLRIWKPVGTRYRLIRTIEFDQGDPALGGYERPESLRLQGEYFIHTMLLMSGTGYLHEDTILWIAPDGTLHDVKFVSPADAYKSQLKKDEGVWKGERNEFSSAGASFTFDVWKEGDANCCPSGNQVTGRYKLVGQKRYDPATKRWSARFQIAPAGFATAAQEKFPE